MGEKAACAGFENGVDTGGVAAAASCEGVRPCCEAPCFIGVGVDMAATSVDECSCRSACSSFAAYCELLVAYPARRLEDEARAASTTSSHESKNILSARGNTVVNEVAYPTQARGRSGESGLDLKYVLCCSRHNS